LPSGADAQESHVVDVASWFAFVAAVTLLMLIPGPNVALIVANSVAYGPRYGLLTLAGTSSAMVVQLCLTALGLAELLTATGTVFEWLRWIGVGYLLYLGIAQWRAPAVNLSTTPPEPKSARAIYGRGLIVSLTNPKTLLFYGAFFPQFVSPGRPADPQLWVLSLTFIAVALLVDTGWAMAAARARGLLAARGRLRNRLSGGVLIGAGAALALARSK
jgi:threonine/homoserine/homoserine lactone efflux protein